MKNRPILKRTLLFHDKTEVAFTHIDMNSWDAGSIRNHNVFLGFINPYIKLIGHPIVATATFEAGGGVLEQKILVLGHGSSIRYDEASTLHHWTQCFHDGEKNDQEEFESNIEHYRQFEITLSDVRRLRDELLAEHELYMITKQRVAQEQFAAQVELDWSQEYKRYRQYDVTLNDIWILMDKLIDERASFEAISNAVDGLYKAHAELARRQEALKECCLMASPT